MQAAQTTSGAVAPAIALKAEAAQLLSRLQSEGYAIAPAAISADLAEAVAHEMAPYFDATPRCEGDFYGWETTRVGALLSKAPLTQHLVLHETILQVAEALLRPRCDCIQLNLTQGVRVHPGERAQAPHRDEEMWPHEPKPETWLLNVMWPLTSFTEENGATRLWPRSHRQALDRSIDASQSVAAEMSPGSALLFLGSLTHGAGANRSAAPRDGIIISYCLGWLKQYENQFLAYPPEVARTFPAELQRLLGYQIHRPNLGGWEGRDPALYLSGEDSCGPHVDALPPAIAAELKALLGANSA